MCGIAGFVFSSKHNYDKNFILDSMLENISHRGYDNRGKYFNKNNNYNLGLGHNRLSIIDTSSRANQPYHFENYSIVFNGEIYNYMELWEELKTHGYTIDTKSDTEVILKLFHLYKEKSISFLNGMFAFVIYDSSNDLLYMVRDRMGVKPLVYFIDNEHLYFSSEIKSFFKNIPKNINISIDDKLLNNYFKYGYINSFDSIFTNVKKVKNGEIVTINLVDFTVTTSKYWNLDKITGKKIDNINEAYNEIQKIVNSAIKYRLISDVGFGIYLSSGIDSNLLMNTIITNTSTKINSFTYHGLDSLSNEKTFPYNSRYVNQINVVLSDYDLWESYKHLCKNYDEPFSDPATVALYGLSKHAKKINKVILVGDGGDELLGGYSSYEELYNYTRPKLYLKIIRILYKPVSPIIDWFFKKFPFAKHTNKIHLVHNLLKYNNLFDIMYELENRYNSVIEKITNLKNIDKPIKTENKNSLLSFLKYKIETELIHQLNYKTDIAGMMQTIEIREPLLDYRLFELQQRFADNIFFDKSKGINNKYLYRKLLLSYNSDFKKIKKTGFKVDLDKIFRIYSDEIEELINNYNSKFLNIDFVKDIWKKYLNDKVDFVFMNRIISFLYWEQNLINRL